MSCLFAASDMTNRILYQLAKLTGEIRQLRRIVEKQAVTRPTSTSPEDAIPEIIDGPVNSLEDCRALLSSCGRKATQDFLVSIVVFVHVVCAHANLYAANYLMCNKFYIMLVGPTLE